MQLVRGAENLTACTFRWSKYEYPGSLVLPDTLGLVQTCTVLAVAQEEPFTYALKFSQDVVKSPSTCWFVSKGILLFQKQDQEFGNFETLLLLCLISMLIFFFKFVSD
jgi:hypothetical protein